MTVDKSKYFTDAQSALEAVMAKLEALQFAQSELQALRFWRRSEKGLAHRLIRDDEPETGVLRDDQGKFFSSDGFLPKYPEIQRRVNEARIEYDAAFARYLEAVRARDADMNRSLAESQAKSAAIQALAAERQARSADEQAKSAKAQADAASAQTRIARTVRGLTWVIGFGAIAQAYAALMTIPSSPNRQHGNLMETGQDATTGSSAIVTATSIVDSDLNKGFSYPTASDHDGAVDDGLSSHCPNFGPCL